VVARRRARLASLKRTLESSHGCGSASWRPTSTTGGGRPPAEEAGTHPDRRAGQQRRTLEGGSFTETDAARIAQMLQLNIGTLVA